MFEVDIVFESIMLRLFLEILFIVLTPVIASHLRLIYTIQSIIGATKIQLLTDRILVLTGKLITNPNLRFIFLLLNQFLIQYIQGFRFRFYSTEGASYCHFRKILAKLRIFAQFRRAGTACDMATGRKEGALKRNLQAYGAFPRF